MGNFREEKTLELFRRAGNMFLWLSKLYEHLYLQARVRREARLIGLEKGSRILCLGCAVVPFTVLGLGAIGCKVDAVEFNSRALPLLKKAAEVSRYGDNISIYKGQRNEVKIADYDLVWVFLPTAGQNVAEKALKEKEKESTLIIGSHRGTLKNYYPDIHNGAGEIMSVLGQEVLLYQQGIGSSVSLCELQPGQRGKIISIPKNPILPPLGIRPGKEIFLQGREIFNGPLIVAVEGRRIALSPSIARKIQLASILPV